MANLIDNDAKVITPGNYGYGHPTVVSFDDNTLFTGHINDLGDLEIHKSIDNGANWTLDTTITPTTGIEFFNLCYRHTGSVDELFVLHSDGSTTYKVQKRTDAGSWSEISSFSITTSGKKALMRFNRSIDRLYICWIYSSNARYSGVRYSDDGGSNWTPVSNDMVVETYNFLADVEIHPVTNNLVLLGMRDDDTNQYWFFHNQAGVDTSYSNEDVGKSYYANVLYDSGGNMTRIRYLFESTTIDIKGRGATSWSIAINNLKAGIDGDDNIYIFYTKILDEKVYYRKYDGSWGSETLLVNVANNKFNCEKHSIPSSAVLNHMYYTV